MLDVLLVAGGIYIIFRLSRLARRIGKRTEEACRSDLDRSSANTKG